MSFVLRCFVAILCLLLFIIVIRLVAKERMLLKYSLLWLFLAVILFCSALFPEIVFSLSGAFGFITPVNFIFLIGLFCLLAISLSLSVVVSRQTIAIKNLVQKLALIEYEKDSVNEKREPMGDISDGSI